MLMPAGKKLKKRLEDLERRVASTSSAPEQELVQPIPTESISRQEYRNVQNSLLPDTFSDSTYPTPETITYTNPPRVTPYGSFESSLSGVNSVESYCCPGREFVESFCWQHLGNCPHG